MKKWIVGMLMAFMISGCGAMYYHDGKYDYSTYRLQRSAKDLQQIEAKLYSVKVVAMMKGKDDPNSKPFEMKRGGIAFSVDGKHLIVLKHVGSVPEKQQMPTPFGYVPIEFEKVSEKYYLVSEDDGECQDGCEFELQGKVSEDSDIMIMWQDGLTFEPINARLGNSDELRVGQSLIVSRTPRLAGHGIAHGMVAHPEYWPLTEEELEKAAGGEKMFGFIIHANLVGGDSGNPVFALRDGKLELVGINQGTMSNSSMSMALRINFVMDVINKLIKDK